MYALVNDIEDYPSFLPWCSKATVHQSDPESLRATLVLKKGPLSHELTTVNSMQPDECIEMRLHEGPFRHLLGTWRFVPIGDSGCEVRLDMDFEFKNHWLEKTIGRVFEEIANTLVDAFCSRARVRYGHG